MKNNSKTPQVLFLAVIFVSFLSNCASKNEESTPKRSGEPVTEKKWDYDKIRQVREDERLTTPIDAPKSPEATLADDCQVVGAAVVKQSKLSGCKKMDPRLGFGENSYCCPRTN